MSGSLMAAEIREIPDVLRRGAIEYRDALPSGFGGFKSVLLAARGSSDHAALYARYLFEARLALPVVLAAPWIVTRKGGARYEDCLAVGVSQSGAGPDVLAVVEAMRDQGHLTIGVTNDPSSPLGRAAAVCLPLNAGPERSVAATKSYAASLLALYEIARALDASLPSPVGRLPDEDWVEACRRKAEADAVAVVESTTVLSLGRGYAYATAREAALKLIECALIPCLAFSTADFEHGPKALAGPDALAVAFSDERLAYGRTIAPPPIPGEIPEELGPLWQVIYAQWLAHHTASLRQLDPDVPRHLDKVTRTY